MISCPSNNWIILAKNFEIHKILVCIFATLVSLVKFDQVDQELNIVRVYKQIDIKILSVNPSFSNLVYFA